MESLYTTSNETYINVNKLNATNPPVSLTGLRGNFKPYDRIMLIFPSSILHCVPSGQNTEPRISLSFNYG